MKLRSTMLAFTACALPWIAIAEHHEEMPPPLSDVWVFAPKADMADEFYEAAEEYIAWRAEQGDSREWTAFTPVIGHEMNRVMFRTCCFDWADQDAYNKESADKEFGKKFNELMGPFVDHHHRYIERTDFENSHWTEENEGPYYGATTWYLNEEFTPQAFEARKKMSSIAKDGWGSETNQWLWLSRIGGASVLQVVVPYSDWADMKPPEVSFFEHVSSKLESEEEVARLFSDFSAGKVKSDYTVWRVIPELSSPDSD